MRSQNLTADHPLDELPEYVRGAAADTAAVESHLAGCTTCRAEVALLRALAGSLGPVLADLESERVYREFEGTRRAEHTAGAKAGSRWMSTAWKVAAGFVMLLTSVGVWRVVQVGQAGWDPEIAVQGFAQDLVDIELSAGELRLALGVGLVDDPALDPDWDMFDETDVNEFVVPWENDR